MTRPPFPNPDPAPKDIEGRALVVLPPRAGDGPGEKASAGPAARKARAKAEAAFSAQMIGQDGVKRGLKGGPPVLEQARSAYLEAEWRGPHDRRMPAGILRKTEV